MDTRNSACRFNEVITFPNHPRIRSSVKCCNREPQQIVGISWWYVGKGSTAKKNRWTDEDGCNGTKVQWFEINKADC